MKNNFKNAAFRLFCACIAVCLSAAAALPLTGAAEIDMGYQGTKYGDIYYEVNDDNETVSITDCDYYAVSVSVPSEINGMKVTQIAGSAFYQNFNLKSAVLPEGVEKIGAEAFYMCLSLTYVSIPDSVTEIAPYAFSACQKLTSLYIPPNVAEIGRNAFLFDYALTRINVDSQNRYFSSLDGTLFDKNKTVLMCHPAGKKDFLYEIPDGVREISRSAFYNNKSLGTVYIPKSVKIIGNAAFEGCSDITAVRYGGSWEEWQKVDIAGGNETLSPIIFAYGDIASATMPPPPEYIEPAAMSVQKTETETAWLFDVTVGQTHSGSYVYAAVYDENSKIIGVKKTPVSDDGTAAVEIEKNGDGRSVKLFAWTNLCQPLAYAEEFTL